MSTFQNAIALGKVSLEQATSIFDSLPSVTIGFMIGKWQGTPFPTGHPVDDLLQPAGWYGKEFIDADQVNPMMFYARDGKEIFSVDPPLFHAMIPRLMGRRVADFRTELETTEPKARLRNVEQRGIVTASMIYNTRPVIDHFRKVDEDTVMVMMEDNTPHPALIFVLRRDRQRN